MMLNSITIYGAVAHPPKVTNKASRKLVAKSIFDRVRFKLGNSQHLDYRNYVSSSAYNKGDLAIASATAQKVRSIYKSSGINFVNWGELKGSNNNPVLISGSGYIHINENHRIASRLRDDLALFALQKRSYALHGVGVNMSASNSLNITNDVNPEDRASLKQLIAGATEVSVRDKFSQHFVEYTTGRMVAIVADPALFIESNTPLSSTKRLDEAPTIGINIPFHGPAATLRVRNDLGRYIKFLMRLQALTKCRFVQTIHFDSEFVIGRIMQDQGICVTQAVGDVQTLLDAYQEMDFHIGGMLHSCILSMSVGTPCIGLAYDIKHQGFFDLIGQRGLCIPVEPFDPERVMAACEHVMKENDAIRHNINVRRLELEVESNRFLSRTLQTLLT